jgi:hypothetical protein
MTKPQDVDATALEVGLRAQNYAERTKTIRWVGGIGISTFPLWMLARTVEAFAGTATSISVSVGVTGFSVAASIGLGVMCIRFTRTIRRQRRRIGGLEDIVDEKEEQIVNLEFRLGSEGETS